MTAVNLIEDLPEVLRSASLMMHLAPNVAIGPTMPNGQRQVKASSGGYWVAEMKFTLNLADELREFIAIANKAGGGTMEFHIPNRRGRQLAPWVPGSSAASVFETVIFSGGRSLSGGRTLGRKVLILYCISNEAVGSTSMSLRVYKAAALRRGMAFTVLDALGRKRMHEVIEPPVVTASTANYIEYQIQFSPPLRGPVRAGTMLDWENPAVVMKFSDVDTGMLTLVPFMRGEPTIRLRESFDTR